MTHLKSTARTVTTPAAAKPVRTGPVLLDLRDCKQVAGGSPKGGWLASSGNALRGVESPKGGW